MIINRYTKNPELWKPFPYAVEAVRKGGNLYYVFGLPRERVMILVLLGGVTLIFVLLSVLQMLSGPNGGAFNQSWLIYLITTGFICSFLWSVHKSRFQSQVCISLADGQTQIQYEHKENAMVDHGEICVVISRIAKQKDWPSQGFHPLVWVGQKFEGKHVYLVVIKSGIDYEIVGAFKGMDAAFEFAEVVQLESGLEIVEDEMPDLQLVDAQRSYGTKDSTAINNRFSSRPFNAR